MEIIPYHNTPSTKVKNWREIKKDALELRKLINSKGDNFKGMYQSAYAIHHSQVSEKPKHFFVINEKEGKGKLKKIFKSWCIINAKILEQYEEVRHKEACMSFPHLKERNVDRFIRIKVRYYVPFLGLLIRKTRWFEDLPSYIIQHEIQHQKGENLYGRIRKEKRNNE